MKAEWLLDEATVERATIAAFNDRYPDRSWDSATGAEQHTWRGNIEAALTAAWGEEPGDLDGYLRARGVLPRGHDEPRAEERIRRLRGGEPA